MISPPQNGGDFSSRKGDCMKKDYQVTVEFDTVGIKKLFAGFAKLKKI